MRLLIIILIACIASKHVTAQIFGKIYEVDSLEEKIANHKLIAVIPFKYSFTTKYTIPDSKLEGFKNQLENFSRSAQRYFHAFAQKENGKSKGQVEIQDLFETNQLLKKDSITEKNINDFSPTKLCAILGVDAVIVGELKTSTLESDNAAAITTVAFGLRMKTLRSKALVSVYDKHGLLLWYYGKEMSVGWGGHADGMIRELMKKSAKKFPYF